MTAATVFKHMPPLEIVGRVAASVRNHPRGEHLGHGLLLGALLLVVASDVLRWLLPALVLILPFVHIIFAWLRLKARPMRSLAALDRGQ